MAIGEAVVALYGVRKSSIRVIAMSDSLVPELSEVADDCLTARLFELRKEERHRMVEFLAYLAEVDRRRLYLALGFSSMFNSCLEHLGLTRSSAFRSHDRSAIARAVSGCRGLPG